MRDCRNNTELIKKIYSHIRASFVPALKIIPNTVDNERKLSLLFGIFKKSLFVRLLKNFPDRWVSPMC